MSAWNSAFVDVIVDYDDLEEAYQEAQKLVEREDKRVAHVTLQAEVEIEDVLEEATADQLRDALGREVEGYTAEQLDAIKDCFAALAVGDEVTASALLPRIFEHQAQIVAAESGLRVSHRRAA